MIRKLNVSRLKAKAHRLFECVVARPTLSAFIAVLMLASVATAGSLTPNASPASTFKTLEEIYDAIASDSFDSSSFAATNSGSLINHLLYIEQNLGWASTSPDIYTLNSGNVGIGDSTPETKFEVVGAASISGTLYANGGCVGCGDVASLSATVEITGDGTKDQLKLSESDSALTYGMLVSDGDFFIRAPSVSAAFSERYVAASIASDSLAWKIGTPASPSIENVGTISTFSKGIYVQGGYAYIAGTSGPTGLAIVDVSDPSAPSTVGTVTLSATPNKVHVVGDYAYVVSGGSADELNIIDVSDPSSPVVLGTYSAGDDAHSIYIAGRHAYIAVDGDGLDVVDISDPTSPTLVGNYNTNGLTTGVYVQGQYAYLGDGTTGGFDVIDIADPTNPTQVGTVSTVGFATEAYVRGRYAYLADDTSGGIGRFAVIDVSDPTSPTVVGTLTTGSSNLTREVHVAGDYAYLANGFGGLMVVDISDPTAPTTVAELQTNNPFDNAEAIFVSGRYAYVGDISLGGFTIVDIGGVNIHALYAGDFSAGTIEVQNDVGIANSLWVGNGISAGTGGLNVQGFGFIASHAGFGSHASIAGNLELGGGLFGASLSDCDSASSKLLWSDTGAFSCGSVSGISSNSIDWDEIVDAMTLDANTTTALSGNTLTFGGLFLSGTDIEVDGTASISSFTAAVPGLEASGNIISFLDGLALNDIGTGNNVSGLYLNPDLSNVSSGAFSYIRIGEPSDAGEDGFAYGIRFPNFDNAATGAHIIFDTPSGAQIYSSSGFNFQTGTAVGANSGTNSVNFSMNTLPTVGNGGSFIEILATPNAVDGSDTLIGLRLAIGNQNVNPTGSSNNLYGVAPQLSQASESGIREAAFYAESDWELGFLSDANVSISADFEVTGTASISGLLSIGSGASISGNVVPKSDNTYSLGLSGLRWSELFVASGSLHIGAAGNDSSITYETSDGTIDYMGFQPDGITTEFRIFEGGNASISGNFEVGGELIASTINISSISGDLEIAGFASASQFFGAGLVDCDTGGTDKLLWDATTGTFSCGTDVGAGTNGWTDDGTVVRLDTATDNVGIGTTTTLAKLTVRGDAGNNQLVSIASAGGTELFSIEKDGDIFLNIGHLGNVGFGMSTGVVPDGQVTFRGDDATNDGEKLFNIEFSNGADKFSVFEGGVSVSIDFEVTGIAKFGAGTAGAPDITFSTDPDVGIFHPAVDELAITTGGIERLVVDATGDVIIGDTALLGGNLGIGDSTPDARLDIVAKSGELIVQIASANGDSVFSILSNGDIILTDDDAVNNQFGNVGIGDPTPDALLGINNFGSLGASDPVFSVDQNNSDRFTLYLGGTASATADWEWSSGAQIIGPDGSRTDPPFTFASDRGAGFYYQAGRNAFAWVNDGNEMLYADEDSFCMHVRAGNLDCDLTGNPMLYVQGNGSNDIVQFASASGTVYFGLNERGAMTLGTTTESGISFNQITTSTALNPERSEISTFSDLYIAGDLEVEGILDIGSHASIGGDLEVSGIVAKFPDGSAAAPGITFGSDPDTGIFQTSVNIMGFSTAGAEAMRIDAAGDIGIGTTTTTARLTVMGGNVSIGTTTDVAQLTVRGDAGNNQIVSIASAGGFEHFAIEKSGDIDIRGGDITINGAATPEGNIGIGTTTTTGGFVTIQGLTTDGATAPDDVILLLENSSSTDRIYFFTGGGASFSNALELTDGYIKIPNGTESEPTLRFQSDPDMGLYRSGTDILGFSTAGTERVIIDATGDTAISTGVLQVSGTSFVTYNRLGTNTTGQGLNANEDLLITDDLEVDGMIFADGGLTMGANIVLGGNSITGGGSFGGTSISVSGGGGFGASVSADEFIGSTGAASDPSFTFSGANQTGMFNGDGVDFAVSGTEIGHFDGAGLDVVGIIDATGGFSDGGTAGIDRDCAAGETLNNLDTSGGLVTSGTCTANASDYTERFYKSDSDLEPGDIVVADPHGSVEADEGVEVYNQGVLRSSEPYQGTIIGIYSGDPGLVIGPRGTEEYPTVTVALAGRVLVKVTGDVHVGDMLTSSETPGVAMKATKPGIVVGMALDTPHASGSDRFVMTFVNPQYWAPSVGDLGEGTLLEELGVSTSFLRAIFDAVIALFSDILGISFEEGKISTDTGEFTEVKTDVLCLEDVCVTKDELKDLLEAGGIEPVDVGESGGSDEGGGSSAGESSSDTDEEGEPAEDGAVDGDEGELPTGEDGDEEDADDPEEEPTEPEGEEEDAGESEPEGEASPEEESDPEPEADEAPAEPEEG